ncbi:MAG: methyltransferase domain-containing protein [Nitrospirales bacterium]|nr:methyltransferase domain-containing protein [Nitrospira sp.]MDR4502860.1 methyltransferase domain-containing protein [Nitrospirales bacterium]
MKDSLSHTHHSRLISEHLASWGLKRFTDEPAYFNWQRTVLSKEQLESLHDCATSRLKQGDPSADIRFYDLTASPEILPILYSQRYDYFVAAGLAIAKRLASTRQVLDFGCGVGILTTFWATLFPDVQFVGVDRSSASLAIATHEATRRQLPNVRFVYAHLPHDSLTGMFDGVICTQALFQAEDSPGLCSDDWNTFHRRQDSALQHQIEAETGIGARLNELSRILVEDGKMLLCEKARHLGRRIVLQRALAARGFHNLSVPFPLTFGSFGERVEDGPLYEVGRRPSEVRAVWDENPEWPKGQSVYTCTGKTARRMAIAIGAIQEECTSEPPEAHSQSFQTYRGIWREAIVYGYVSVGMDFQGMILASREDESIIVEYFERLKAKRDPDLQTTIRTLWGDGQGDDSQGPIPCYENHTPAAQLIWERLPARCLQEEETYRSSDGRAMHLELGESGPLTYLYWANTLDQRQIILADSSNADWFVRYYREAIHEMKTSVRESPPR